MSGLTKLAPDLWLDLTQVVSVRTFTEKTRYHRIVELRTRDGIVHRVTAVHHNGHRSVGAGDLLLAEWLAENLAPLVGDEAQRASMATEQGQGATLGASAVGGDVPGVPGGSQDDEWRNE